MSTISIFNPFRKIIYVVENISYKKSDSFFQVISFLIHLLILIPIKTFALIEVDITRGNLSPLPLAVSPLAIDKDSKKEFEKILLKVKTESYEKDSENDYDFKIEEYIKL